MWAIAFLVVSGPASPQVGHDTPQPSLCLRFAFDVWNPPLNWEGAGHQGNADANAQAARRLRDSIFLQQPGSAAADGMVWDEKSAGQRVYVFPAWWPVGIVVQFDSGGEDSFDADAVAAHDDRRFLAVLIEHARAH